MDGLECNELLFSEVQKNRTFRFDAEFFSKEALSIESFFSTKKHFFLKKDEVVSGPFGSTLTSSSYCQSGDVALVRIENIKGGFHINRDNLVYISHNDNARISNSQLYTDDLILSKVGNSIGFFARVDDEMKTCNISENNIGIKLSAYKKHEKHVILSYLNSKYGQALLLRRKSGNAQPKLNVDDVCFIPIPQLSKSLSYAISNIIIESDKLLSRANSIYKNTSDLLLKEINFNDESMSKTNIAEKLFSESFAKTGRLDAEYYHPKYDNFITSLKSKDFVGNICHIYDKNFVPDGNSKYQYIELANVDLHGNISDVETVLGKELPSRARRKVYTGQIIISSLGGSLQNCAIVPNCFDEALVSTGFFVLDSEKINSETLFMIFTSKPMQNLLTQQCTGTILSAISKESLKKIPIPLINFHIQQKIANGVQLYYEIYNKSKSLTRLAVSTIEVALESSEENALAFINEHTRRMVI